MEGFVRRHRLYKSKDAEKLVGCDSAVLGSYWTSTTDEEELRTLDGDEPGDSDSESDTSSDDDDNDDAATTTRPSRRGPVWNANPRLRLRLSLRAGSSGAHPLQ